MTIEKSLPGEEEVQRRDFSGGGWELTVFLVEVGIIYTAFAPIVSATTEISAELEQRRP